MPCCSSVSAVERSPAQYGTPSTPNEDWKKEMLLDIGADPFSVIRDFPRMIVFVHTGRRHNYGSVPHCSSALPAFRLSNQDAAFEERLERVPQTVQLLAELSGEENSFGMNFCREWESQIQKFKSNRQALAEVDVHSVMECAVKSSQMFEMREDQLIIYSKTFALMLFTVQGVMFYPSQQLLSLVRMPWVSHMQDSGWTIHIYTGRATDSPEKHYDSNPIRLPVIIQHRQMMKHYVPSSDESSVPRFEVEYTTTVTVDMKTRVEQESPIAVREMVRDVQLEVVHIRLEIPRCSCFLTLWKSRARELKRKASELGAPFLRCKAL